MRYRICSLLLLLLATPLGLVAAESPADPLNSVMWHEMHQRLLDGAPVVFDERVQVSAPAVAEDSLNLPLWIDATALGEVKRLLVFAELNPIPKVLDMQPIKAAPRIGLRIKVQQATPVRAAALTADGVWHLGGVLVDAAGGGCTAPSIGSGSSDWADRLGEVTARLWSREHHSRLRASIVHPMDTGLVAGIPAFYLEQLEIRESGGDLISRLSLFEPIAENPVLTLDLPKLKQLTMDGRDNNGNPVAAQISLESQTGGSRQ
ncbi:MAG: quinoprotein dehydrogenase-associated SoxYZ-like carrier [Candidatus Thiodiazotropha sp. 'RUGA']|nr:quinoprotein dehydrogenase-associated SoxYZ-like carrier [Candidatus Thiodiazotropha sp. 'RUGA']